MLERIRNLRKSAAVELAAALRGFESVSPSEVEIRDAWHERLARDRTTCAEGWYLPPPHGLIVAVGNPPTYDRAGSPNFRSVGTWPRSEHRLGRESLLYVCSTRVDRITGTLGDQGCSLYRGSDSEIRAHLRTVWELTNQIAGKAEIGLTFAELYDEAMALIRRSGLTNDIQSSHHGDDTNIGHSLPWSDEPLGPAERRILATGTAQQIADLVSGRRSFVSETGTRVIADGSTFTIEPRLTAPGLPTVSFHLTVGFEAGVRFVIGGFDSLFDLFGMDYLTS